MTLATVVTWNLVFKGVIGGLITALVAMGIVLVYRSSRVINFAVGSIGIPATALFAVMVGVHGWPYWPSLILALILGTLTGVLVELAVIRRLFKSPRVIVLVATIGVAQLCEAITLALPDYRTGSLQTQFPVPFEGDWNPVLGIEVSASQLLVLIVVPVITVGLWWLLGHTAFGDSVRAAASNSDLARMTGINPKMVSTGVWAIAGFLGTVAILLTATDQTSADLVHIGPDTLLRGMAAALIGGMVSFPRAVVGAVAIGILDRVLFFNYTSETGLVQFVLFLVVLVLVARVSRNDSGSGGESFQFAPRIAAVPERLRSIWWVKRMPQFVALLALLAAVILPMLQRQVGAPPDLGHDHRLRAVRGLGGGAHRLGRSALARADGVRRPRRAHRRRAHPRAGVQHRLARARGSSTAASAGSRSRGRCCSARRSRAWSRWSWASGALRVRGLLLAISTLAFAIAAQAYIFNRPFFTAGSTTVEIPRTDIGFLELTHRNRAYYYFVLFVLVLVLLLVGHLKRTGIGRMIVGVRENELAASAMTVSPARAKLIAFAVGGFIAGLGGVLLGAVNLTFGPSEALLPRRGLAAAHRHRRDRRARQPLGRGGRRAVGDRPAVVLARQQPRAAVHVEHRPAHHPALHPGRLRADRLLRARLAAAVGRQADGSGRHDQDVTAPPASLTRVSAARTRRGQRRRVGARHRPPHRAVRRPHRGRRRRVPGHARRGHRAHRQQRCGQVDAAQRHRRLRAREGHGAAPRARRQPEEARTSAPGAGWAARSRPRASTRSSRCATPCSSRSRRATRRRSGARCSGCRRSGPSARKYAEASELIDFLGLGRYADRYVAELSTGTRRIVELATVLAVAPRVICLDEPTAGVAQREAEAFGPLILRVKQELDATLIVVEHDLPLILSISSRIYCLEAGRVIAEGLPPRSATIRG